MQEYRWSKPFNVQKAYAALIAAIPALAPQPNAAGALVSPLTVESIGGVLRLTFPDGISAAAVTAALSAADATATAPALTPRQAARAAMVAAQTLADVKTALLAFIDAG